MRSFSITQLRLRAAMAHLNSRDCRRVGAVGAEAGTVQTNSRTEYVCCVVGVAMAVSAAR
jgi:hypothetical protein